MSTRFAIAVIAAGALCGAGREGLKPRASASDYPASATGAPAEIGALLLSPDETRSRFSTDVSRGYLVVEVGVYPKNGAALDLGPGDFMLQVEGRDESIRPVGPRAIAGILQKSGAGDREVTLYPSVGVGYESGRGYDGVRRGGWSTSTGVGVGIGDSRPPASTDADRRTMEMELAEQQLPEKVITSPVAGYLYFPVKPKPGQKYVLEYQSPGGKTAVNLEPQRGVTK